ncbi:MarR family winged helix-turn-helix transcriptional regulator [uncultured Pseudokineococcus sp.]|uniref:MarR family winged helix-turn-helix transcriptional regulator n=1 Tax=uncultured Pseudokineococcus sp. TaxID=1642928 RepID=UPI00260CF43D|nr:MarR family winged helix-turn-helix transcriptional regulator [uncultured Pseudokineococcus sp.]
MITTSTAEALLEQARGLHRSSRAMLRASAPDRTGAAAEAVLGVVAEAGESRPGALACRLGTSPSVLSRQLAELEDAGLLDRRADPADGRAHLVRVSTEGAALLAETAAARAERLRRALDGWTEDEARSALESLARLRRDLEASGPGRVLPAPDDHRLPPATGGRRRPAVQHHDPTTAATGPRAARAEQEVGA